MGRLTWIDYDAIAEACTEGLEAAAEKIATDARRGYQQHELKTSNTKMGVIVESDADGVRVTTHNPFAHLDEWGGAGVHSRPTGAMRSAAMRAGEFHPEGRQ
jgi:hypothetical protein